ncbi:MAG: hypothetical protein ABI068_02035 [Ktedonobacterales bacterium]
MRGVFTKADSGQHAITDVYDEQRRFFLVHYPVWLVTALALFGVIAFGLTGFVGYRDHAEPAITGLIFHRPWPLFLWFCALIIGLEISVLRHRALRRQLVEVLIVTIASMLFEGLAAYDPELVNYILNNLLNIRIAIPQIGDSPWTWAIINFGIIAIFWVDTFRRWFNSARGAPVARVLDLGIGVSIEIGEAEDLPKLPELISGDLIAGGVLVALLSLVFRPEFLSPISQALNGVAINTCAVSLPLTACHVGAANNQHTLSFIDLIQSLIYLPLGLLLLALTATANAFQAVGPNAQAQQSGQTAGAGAGGSASLSTFGSEANATGAQGAGATVAETVINALRSALNRRIRIAIDNLLIALRNVVWPVLILFATISVGSAAKEIEQYLHLQSDSRTCTSAATCVDFQAVQAQLANYGQYTAAGIAFLWGIVAVIALVLALTMLIFSLRVLENTTRFLGLVGFIVLLTFWIFSLALASVNQLLLLLNVTGRQPFPFLGASTIASILAFLVALSIYLVQRRRPPRVAATVTARGSSASGS